jgi:hypothetical protein
MNYTDKEVRAVAIILACDHPTPFKHDPVMNRMVCSECGATNILIEELAGFNKRLLATPISDRLVTYDEIEHPATHKFNYHLPLGYHVEELPIRRVALDWALYFRGVLVYTDGEPFRPPFPANRDYNAAHYEQMRIIAHKRNAKLEAAIVKHKAEAGEIKTGQYRAEIERMGMFSTSNQQLKVIRAWVAAHEGAVFRFTFVEGGPVVGDSPAACVLIDFLQRAHTDEGWMIALTVAFEDLGYNIKQISQQGSYCIVPAEGSPVRGAE